MLNQAVSYEDKQTTWGSILLLKASVASILKCLVKTWEFYPTYYQFASTIFSWHDTSDFCISRL